MRKTLEMIALLLLLFLWTVTVRAVFGSHALPARIATHFDAAGQPDGWGTPAMLWMLPGIATIIYLLMSLVARYPSALHFPMRTQPVARRRLEVIALNMISWLNVEVVCLFAWIQYETVAFARRGQGTLSPVFLPLVLVAVFGTIALHVNAMRRVARTH
jgi:hypothetical protein